MDEFERNQHKKGKKNIRPFIPAIVAAIILVAIIVGSIAGGNNDKTTLSAPTTNQTRYAAESYAVGTDIPEGDYVAYPDNGSTAKYKVTEDVYGFNVLREEYIGSIWTITLNDNEYIFLDNCYIVPILETPSCNDLNFNIHQYEVKNVRLKVGYHVPAGEYVFNASVKVYSNLYETDNEAHLKYVFDKYVSEYFDYDTSNYIICNLKDGEYCEVSTAVDYKNFLTLEESKNKVEIKEHGVYKIGVHLPSGLYTLEGTSDYYELLGETHWTYGGTVEIYNDRKLQKEIEIDRGQNTQVELHDGQIVDFNRIKIIRRDDFPS